MMKIFAWIVLLAAANQVFTAKYPSKMDFIMRNLEKFETSICQDSIDCPENYFCDQNGCVAKKKEGSLCLSGLDEECQCGKCILDEETYSFICQNEKTECENDGYTKENSCSTHEDCFENYFCNEKVGNVCTSKFTNGKICRYNAMCYCNLCSEKLVYSRKSLKPIKYNICEC